MSNMPAPNAAFLDKNGNVSPAWWALLLTLVSPSGNGGTAGVIQQLQAAIAELEASNGYVVGATWSGGGGAVSTPTPDISMICKSAGTIVSATILTTGGTGACQIGVWKAPYGVFPPTAANSITGLTPPAIGSGIKYQDGALVGWNTSVNAGDVIAFHLGAASVFTTIEILLTIQA